MNWINQHRDVLIIGLLFISWALGYVVGREAGYRQGLEDGYADAQVQK